MKSLQARRQLVQGQQGLWATAGASWRIPIGGAADSPVESCSWQERACLQGGTVTGLGMCCRVRCHVTPLHRKTPAQETTHLWQPTSPLRSVESGTWHSSTDKEEISKQRWAPTWESPSFGGNQQHAKASLNSTVGNMMAKGKTKKAI